MALGAPPQTPGRLRRKSGLLGAPPPDPRWGSAPDPLEKGSRAQPQRVSDAAPRPAAPPPPSGYATDGAFVKRCFCFKFEIGADWWRTCANIERNAFPSSRLHPPFVRLL